MKKWMPLLALLVLLTGCSGREAVEPADTETPDVLPAPQQTESAPPAPAETAEPLPAEETPLPAESLPLPGASQPAQPEPTGLPAPESPAPGEGELTDEEILAAYQRAEEAYNWFVMGPPALDRSDPRTVGELVCFPVDNPRFSTLADLRGYLKGLFSDSLVEQLLPADSAQFMDVDGVLCAVDAGRGADITRGGETLQVMRDGTPGRYTVRVTVEVLDPEQDYAVVGSEDHDFLYEQVGDRWIFTTFSAVR